LDGFEGLQGLWTGGGESWDFRPERFFFEKNQGKKFKKKSSPLPISPTAHYSVKNGQK
jgi:hypothetical protein